MLLVRARCLAVAVLRIEKRLPAYPKIAPQATAARGTWWVVRLKAA